LSSAGVGAAAQAVQPIAGAPLRLSLNEALKRGLNTALSLQSSQLDVEENRALLGLAKTRFLPKLDLVALGTYAQVGTNIGFISNVPTIGDINLSVNANGYANVQNSFANVGLAINYPLLDFGRGPLKQAAQASLAASQSSLSEQQRRTRFDIESAYLNAQLAEALIPVWQQSVNLSNILLANARAIRRVGLAARIDTSQAEALLQTDRAGLADALAQRQIAFSGLARVLNEPAHQELVVSDPLQRSKTWPLSLGATLDHSLQQRPSLEALEYQRQAQLAAVRLARSSLLPSVGLLLGGGFNGDRLNVQGEGASSSLSGTFYDVGALVNVRQPLFDGGVSQQSTALAQRRLEQSAVAIEVAKQAITQSVQTWFAIHGASGLQIEAAAAAVRAGNVAVADALLRYRAGIAPITECLIAQRNLQAARSAEATALHRWNLARAGLSYETGLP
jgi:outer membrane protein TolC